MKSKLRSVYVKDIKYHYVIDKDVTRIYLNKKIFDIVSNDTIMNTKYDGYVDDGSNGITPEMVIIYIRTYNDAEKYFYNTPEQLNYNYQLLEIIKHAIRDRVWYKPTYDFDNKKLYLSKIKVEGVCYPKVFSEAKIQTWDNSYLINTLTLDENLSQEGIEKLFHKLNMQREYEHKIRLIRGY